MCHAAVTATLSAMSHRCCVDDTATHPIALCSYHHVPGEPLTLNLRMHAGNYITGTLPPELGQLSQLQQLNLGKNGFTDMGLCA
jgi:hypothetical protein